MLVSIANRVLYYNPNISKREGYAVDLEIDNFKNKLYHTVNTIGLNDLGCLIGGLYIDTDNAWEYPTTKLISALANHKNSEITIHLISEIPILIYQSKDYIKPFNDWNNPDFFTTAFLSFFLFRISDYLTKKYKPR